MSPVGDDAGVQLPQVLTDVALMIDDVTCPVGSPCANSTEIVYANTFVPFDSSF